MGKVVDLKAKQNFIDQTLKDIFGWSEARVACGHSEVFDRGIQNIIKSIDQEIQNEDPTGKKRDKYENMSEYPEKEWDAIVGMRVVTLLALKDYAERASDYIRQGQKEASQ